MILLLLSSLFRLNGFIPSSKETEYNKNQATVTVMFRVRKQRFSFTYQDIPDVLQALKPKNVNVDKYQR